MIGLDRVVPRAVFERFHPFTWVREPRSSDPVDDIERWRPGARDSIETQPGYSKPICHAEGIIRHTIISVHKPPGYQERVFFLRHYYDPDGMFVGPPTLHHLVTRAFRREVERYQTDYEVHPL
jgi:hypothetical protein